MARDADQAAAELQRDGEARAAAAFQQALNGVESLAVQLCPVGHYGRARGKPGRSGGDLRQSLVVEYLGRQGDLLNGRATSALDYASAQHEGNFHHPGLYTGAAGPKYRSLFFKAAADYIFGNAALYNPGALPVLEPARFQELLNDPS